ncbi:MAG: tRNA (adenosine(37)-N6)-threonylcarbamoyltransferase complex transferase subunit TsaD [Thermodesulfobacteriota bacterium]
MGIESSCDETAVAIVEGETDILSDVVASQNEIHNRYGGVVPELASRRHMEVIVSVAEEALARARVAPQELDAIAVTCGPGLIGSLLVGLSFAKGLAYGWGKPLLGVNHLEGHLLSIFLEQELAFPYLGLVASGGHTSLYLVNGFGEYELLGATLDDAVGEAFDKVAKLLGLGYPGGAIIDRLAKDGDPAAIEFPRASLSGNALNFSFSGVKTAVAYFVRRLKPEELATRLADLVAGFQEAAVDMLLERARLAACKLGLRRVVICGGVASNSRLRRRFKEELGLLNKEVFFPSPSHCTDNGAMIAHAGLRRLIKGESSSLALDAQSSLPLGGRASGIFSWGSPRPSQNK